MKPKITWIAWAFCGFVSLVAIRNVIYQISNPTSGVGISEQLTQQLLGGLIPVIFAALGALIVYHQPRNLVGWLLFIPAVSQTISPLLPDYQSWAVPPSPVKLSVYFGLWISGFGWLFLIFPVFLIMLLFPNGRPPTPRWNWVGYLALAMPAFLIFIGTFSTVFTIDGSTSWEIPNPIGFIPTSFISHPLFMPIWGLFLFFLVAACVTSLVVRFRRAGPVEREQIKWLVYSCVLFGAAYIVAGLSNIFIPSSSNTGILNLVMFLSMATIPAAIAIAVLRYRLWDIDVIIRRTLIYAILTGALALVFFGGVALVQGLFGKLTGVENSPVAIVISTLVIVALFNPLRRRVQNAIDRRFYRKKYDAEKALTNFAARARDETDIERLSTELVSVVDETMQPASLSLWINPIHRSDS